MTQPLLPPPPEQQVLTGALPRREPPAEEMPDRQLLQEPQARPATRLRRPDTFGERGAAAAAAGQDFPLPPRGAGYTVLSYLIAGIVVYGGIGWLVGRAVHSAALFPIGMLIGLMLSIGLVIHRYGRS
jgi:F0F1-type ATP synthase assembly protein I